MERQNDAAAAIMTRIEIRHLKRVIRNSSAADATEEDTHRGRTSAIALLEHSMQRGHKRLAVIRFAAAIRTGATITPPHWKYCQAAMDSISDNKLRRMVIDAIDRAAGNQVSGL